MYHVYILMYNYINNYTLLCIIIKRRRNGGTISAPPFGRRPFGAADSAPDIRAPFPNLFLFFELRIKNNEAGNSLNPNASEASYKSKQRSYRRNNLKKKFWRQIVPSPKCPAPNRWRPNGGTETYPTRRNQFLIKTIFSIFEKINYLSMI